MLAHRIHSNATQPHHHHQGVVKPLCEACGAIGWRKPTGIQQQAIPAALEGRDVIGLAETGSGKTGAFALPVLQALLAKPQRLFAVVLAPTRELAFQIHEVFEALGASIGLKCCCVVGGVDMMTQAIALARKPHVVIATPGRLVDHLENTKGFSLREVKYLVLDEVGRCCCWCWGRGWCWFGVVDNDGAGADGRGLLLTHIFIPILG